ncbi:MAG: cytochrome P450, partial [Actinomycetota bacterium]
MERTDTEKLTQKPRASFDPEAPGFLQDPYAHYRRLREEDPVHRTPFGYWVVSRYADVSAILRDPRFGKAFGRLAAAPMTVARGGADSALVGEMSTWMLFRDPPDHTRLRGLVTKAFTPRVVEGMRPRIQAIVDELLDRVADDGRMDVIADFAFPLPVTVITEILGLSTGESERCRAWTVAVARALDPTQTPEHVAQAAAAVVEISEYVRSRVAVRRREPREGLLSALVAAEEGGGRLSEEELISTVNLLFAAGHETTVNLIGNGVLA